MNETFEPPVCERHAPIFVTNCEACTLREGWQISQRKQKQTEATEDNKPLLEERLRGAELLSAVALKGDSILHEAADTVERVRALVPQWRKQAEHLAETMRGARAAELRLCADELEAAINGK